MFPGRNYALQCFIEAGANVLCTNEATKRCVCCAVRYVMVIAVKLLSSLYGYCVVLHGAQATERGATPPEVSSGQVPLPARRRASSGFLENYSLQRIRVMAG